MDMATCCCCAEFHPDGEMEPSMPSGVGAVMRDGCATTTRWTVGARQWLAASIDHIHRRDRLSSYWIRWRRLPPRLFISRWSSCQINELISFHLTWQQTNSGIASTCVLYGDHVQEYQIQAWLPFVYSSTVHAWYRVYDVEAGESQLKLKPRTVVLCYKGGRWQVRGAPCCSTVV